MRVVGGILGLVLVLAIILFIYKAQLTQGPAGGAPPMQTIDVIALCQADLPWPTSCPYITDPKFANRMVEVAAYCGSTAKCSNVPPDCRQPVAPAAQPDGGVVPQPAVDTGVDPLDTM